MKETEENMMPKNWEMSRECVCGEMEGEIGACRVSLGDPIEKMEICLLAVER